MDRRYFAIFFSALLLLNGCQKEKLSLTNPVESQFPYADCEEGELLVKFDSQVSDAIEKLAEENKYSDACFKSSCDSGRTSVCLRTFLP